MTAVGRTERVVDAFGVLFLSIPERSRGQPGLLLLIGLTLKRKAYFGWIESVLATATIPVAILLVEIEHITDILLPCLPILVTDDIRLLCSPSYK
jgi:hypothetical protein